MRKLIYDVGMHKGEDTDFYLKKGFDVVGIEADPTLVVGLRERFAKELDSGRTYRSNRARLRPGWVFATR